nr:MAG TPA_asm: hypothetical protein [Caudoviricetes sp.]
MGLIKIRCPNGQKQFINLYCKGEREKSQI